MVLLGSACQSVMYKIPVHFKWIRRKILNKTPYIQTDTSFIVF